MRFKELKRLIRMSVLRDCQLYHAMRFRMHKAKYIADIKRFRGNVNLVEEYRLLKEMRRATMEYHWNSEEFFLFNYEKLTDEQRREFVCEYDKNVFCDQVNNAKDANIFYSKWKTYEMFKGFFKRDAVLVKSTKDVSRKDVRLFLSKHFCFIMKPIDSACGRGIQVVNASCEKDATHKLINILESLPMTYIVEELIVQVDEMACFHPKSVNTIRIPTINYGDEVEILRCFFRTGRGDSFVDNAGAGGVFGEIDTDTGVIIAACDERGYQYSVHPDTHIQMVGTKVPCWKDAIEIAKKLSKVLPNVVYVGWDLALTDQGWVLVEGNDKGQFLFQYTQGKGFTRQLDQIKQRLGV